MMYHNSTQWKRFRYVLLRFNPYCYDIESCNGRHMRSCMSKHSLKKLNLEQWWKWAIFPTAFSIFCVYYVKCFIFKNQQHLQEKAILLSSSDTVNFKIIGTHVIEQKLLFFLNTYIGFKIIGTPQQIGMVMPPLESITVPSHFLLMA